MFREALAYPTRPPRGGRAVLVGGTLLLVVGLFSGVAALDTLLVPVALLALVPYLLVRGYYVRVVRTTLVEEFPTPPPFGDVSGLLRDGVTAVLITMGYLLPGVAVLAPLAYVRTRDTDIVGLLLGEGAAPAVVGAVTAGVGVVALFAVFALMAAAYVVPVAVANYAYEGGIRASFDLQTVVSGAATEDYVVAWSVSVLLQLLVLPVASLLTAILVGFYLQFLLGVGVRYCYGRGVGAALGVEPREPTFGAATGLRTTSEDGAEPAVRPIEQSDVPELRTSAADEGVDPDDPFLYPAREGLEGERSEGERT